MEEIEVSFKTLRERFPEGLFELVGIAKCWVSGKGWINPSLVAPLLSEGLIDQVRALYESGAEKLSFVVKGKFPQEEDNRRQYDVSIFELLPGVDHHWIAAQIYESFDSVSNERVEVERSAKNELTQRTYFGDKENEAVKISSLKHQIFNLNSYKGSQDVENTFLFLKKVATVKGGEASGSGMSEFTSMYLENGEYRKHTTKCLVRFTESGIVRGDKISDSTESISLREIVKLYNSEVEGLQRLDRFEEAMKLPIAKAQKVIDALYQETASYRRNIGYQALEKLLPVLHEAGFKGARVEGNGIQLSSWHTLGSPEGKITFTDPVAYEGISIQAERDFRGVEYNLKLELEQAKKLVEVFAAALDRPVLNEPKKQVRFKLHG